MFQMDQSKCRGVISNVAGINLLVWKFFVVGRKGGGTDHVGAQCPNPQDTTSVVILRIRARYRPS